MIFLVTVLLAAQTIEIYRVRHRPAGELVAIAESALGTDGQVTLDARSATLVLNGSPEAVRRAVALLERMDRPLRDVILDVTVRDVTDLDALGVDVAWKTSIGPIRIGTATIGPHGLAVALDASRTDATRTSGSRLRLTEGGTGIVRTGRALPVLFSSYWTTATGYVPLDTGFEASVQILDDDLVHLELRPFAGRVAVDGTFDYIAAAASVTVEPGETVILAETGHAEESSTTGLRGAKRDGVGRRQVVLVSVELAR